MGTMKAVFCTAYGSPDVLELREIERPAPKPNEILVKIAATAVTPGDCEMRTCTIHPSMYPMFRLFVGLRKPRQPILGMYFSGTVVQLGSEVSNFAVGDEVFGTTSFSMGTNGEYVCIPYTRSIVKKPDTLSHCEAAAVPIGAWNALHFLKRANLKAGETLLVIGAGGAIGTFAVQLAKHWGLNVTAIDSAAKLPMLLEAGADSVIDYETEDFTASALNYDVIFDVVGKSNYRECLKHLNPKGRYLLANVGFTPMLRGMWTTMTTDKTVVSALAAETISELIEITELLSAGNIKPIIDRTFTLEQIPEAHRYLDSGARKGNTVVVMET